MAKIMENKGGEWQKQFATEKHLSMQTGILNGRRIHFTKSKKEHYIKSPTANQVLKNCAIKSRSVNRLGQKNRTIWIQFLLHGLGAIFPHRKIAQCEPTLREIFCITSFIAIRYNDIQQLHPRMYTNAGYHISEVQQNLI